MTGDVVAAQGQNVLRGSRMVYQRQDRRGRRWQARPRGPQRPRAGRAACFYPSKQTEQRRAGERQPPARLEATNARRPPAIAGEGLVVDNIGKSFRGRPVVKGVSLRLRRGEVAGLLGPNGAGKTTCFYMITGLIPADYGAI